MVIFFRIHGYAGNINFPLWSVKKAGHPTSIVNKINAHECIPVGCIPPACFPYLPACIAPGGCTWYWGDVPGPVGGCTWSWGGVPGPGGCTWFWGVYLIPEGCTWSGGCTWSWRGYLPRYSPLWTEFLTHACENITLPQTSFAGGKYALHGTILPSSQAILNFSFPCLLCISFLPFPLLPLTQCYSKELKWFDNKNVRSQNSILALNLGNHTRCLIASSSFCLT